MMQFNIPFYKYFIRQFLLTVGGFYCIIFELIIGILFYSCIETIENYEDYYNLKLK